MRVMPSLWCLVCCCSWGTALLPAQENNSPEQSALVDGLLELLNEPAPAKDQPASPKPGPPPTNHAMDGEDLGQASSNPLQVVRESMLTAAGYLSKGFISQQTLQLQSEIVVHLDELIEQLEQANPAQQSQSQQQQQQSQELAQSEQPESSPQSPSPGPPAPGQADDGSEPQSESAQQSPATPSQNGKGANPTVDLVDPRTLQQNAWGELPEQVRKQMQSRMVERFLPSYRQQIEAYFQALIESSKESR